jgi:uncharacterized alpha-E superfamily protein
MLLSRVADNVFWAARYLERAEDTARMVRAYTDVIIDLPTHVVSSWEPLLAVVGHRPGERFDSGVPDEERVVRHLLVEHPGSVQRSVVQARENLRTCREVLPREAWQTVNDLYLYVNVDAAAAIGRAARPRVLGRVIKDCQQLDGILTSTMCRDHAYELWRFGQVIERADMTTRVLGVRAEALLLAAHSSTVVDVEQHNEVQWMGVLRSLGALQMYLRATRSPIDGERVVQFLLGDSTFPRSIAHCVARMRESVGNLPPSAALRSAVERLGIVLSSVNADPMDGARLDVEMDRLQSELATVSAVVRAELFGFS